MSLLGLVYYNYASTKCETLTAKHLLHEWLLTLLAFAWNELAMA
jgi:hypothetical protein